MPTGYTADVAIGKITELEPFVMQLARGMGALITMRDEPPGAPIPKRFGPSPYYAERIAEHTATREALKAMTDAEARAAADAEMAAYTERRADAEADWVEQRNRYDAMIAKVVQWEGAPEGIKEFALEQLHRGREFDCGQEFTFWQSEPITDGAAWRAAKLARVAERIAHAESEYAKEQKRTDERNAWVDQLRASLTQPTEKEAA